MGETSPAQAQGETSRASEKDRHLLIAVDDSDNSRRAVLYVAEVLGNVPRVQVTLLHVLALPPGDFFPTPAARVRWIEERRTAMEELLEGYRRLLVDAGFARPDVALRIITWEAGPLADAILEEHRKLQTCTIVIGRHGKSREEEFLFGSVSTRIVHLASNCSIWIIN